MQIFDVALTHTILDWELHSDTKERGLPTGEG